MRFILSIFLLYYSTSLFGQSTSYKTVKDLFNNGLYHECLKQTKNKLSEKNIELSEKIEYYQLLADNYLILNHTENFKKYSTQSFQLIEKKTTLDTSFYYSNISEYFNYLLMSDSAIFYAFKSLIYLNKSDLSIDSTKTSRILTVYANSVRNADKYYKNFHQWKKGDSIYYKRAVSLEYFDKALKYANKYQIPIILRRKAISLTDVVYFHAISAKKPDFPLVGYEYTFNQCKNLFYEAIDKAKNTYKNPRLFLSQCYSLLGLTYQYNWDYQTADSLYQMAIEYSMVNDSITNLYEYNTACSWKGWNAEEWFETSHNVNHLYKALSVFEKSVDTWLLFSNKFGDKNKGIYDGYRVSSIHKIPHLCYTLFNLTNDSSLINKALYYGNLDVYPTYFNHQKTKQHITYSDIQQLLQRDETLVMYLTSHNPNYTHAIIISPQKTDFLFLNKEIVRIFSPEVYQQFNGKTNQYEFRKENYKFYHQYFRKIDSLLTEQNAQNVIIIPSNGFSQLNFDFLISDTLARSWKDYPYMFHKYNFSYALNLSVFNDNYIPCQQQKAAISILKGSFKDKPNLIFTDKLINDINNNFKSTINTPKNLEDFKEMSSNYNICMLIGHGKENSYTNNPGVYLSDSLLITSESIFNSDLNDNLFITTACNTDKSYTYMSEGSTSGFTKALMYAGVKSTLTTNWEIDDKTNAFIINRFLHYLSKGFSKSKALWKSKKDYWNNCLQNEEFNPFYWGAYRLTGNTTSINIQNKKTFNYYYLLFLLVIPFGFVVFRLFQ